MTARRLDPVEMPTCAMLSSRQVTAALHFFAEGGYQRGVGQDSFVALSQPSTGRCIHNVCNAVSDLLADRWIVFPTTAAQRERISPSIGISQCDCTHTHIAITTPHEDEEAYYNHHEFHSLNVQGICALNVNARFPGRVPDQFIWRDSAVKVEMRRLHRERIDDFYFIGVSGHAPEQCMLTPFTYAVEGTPERFFGMLKGRFRCLFQDRTLHHVHAQEARIIETCVVKHNVMIHYIIPFDEETMVAEPYVPAQMKIMLPMVGGKRGLTLYSGISTAKNLGRK
uniref:DDE Tnp4 domain-containing protein n=1 Tax=Timema monikensis TaxID=170555 RepID=A0A7R9EDE9_9NEOP|nr:unnamed protein product [Timema monikensis]